MDKQLTYWHRNPTSVDDILDCFKTGSTQPEIWPEWTDEPLTRKAIAARVERKVTPKLIAMIESMVDAQILEKHRFQRRNGIWGYEYTVIGA